MNRFVLSAATAAALVIAGGAGEAQDTKPGAKDAPKSEKATVVTPEAEAVQNLEMAFRLATYGRKAKSPEALITAARVIGTTPVQKDDKAKLPEGVKAFDPAAEADELLAEALKLPGVTDGTKALAKATKLAIEERPRGALGGPRVFQGVVGPGGTATYQVPFRIGDLATLTVRNTTHSDLDLYVMCNRSGWSTHDRAANRDASVAFTVGGISTSGFTVRVVNYSTNQSGNFVLFTN